MLNRFDLFAFKINYNTVQGGVPGVGALYNGNIAETYWRTASDDIKRKYGYKYDSLNRLKEAIYQKPDDLNPTPNSYNETLTYDKNGNITTLRRNGDLDDPSTVFQIDNLSYSYPANSNVLSKVTDLTNNTSGFKDGTNTTDDYAYDTNGNMVKDLNKGIGTSTVNGITYNHLNLPTKIIFNNDTNTRIEYLYNALGQKVQKKVFQYCDSCVGGLTNTTTDYLSGFQYTTTGTVVKLSFFPHAEGYVNNTIVNGANVYNYVFNYTDHLGNIRLSYAKDPVTNVLKIIEENHYYPFGLKHTNYNSDKNMFQKTETNAIVLKKPIVQTRLEYQIKYQGQERQDELGLNWDSFKWRNYDYAIGRFMCIDPLAEKYAYNGTYNFSENRVIDGRELEGLEWVDSKNNVVYDPKLNDGKGGFTEFATNNHRNLAKSLNQTDTGKVQFGKLVNSTTPVETVLNTTDKPVDKKGHTTLAETTFTNLMEGKNPDTGKVEDVSFSKSTITFYMQNIDEVSELSSDGDSKTGVSLYGTKVPEGFNFSDIIGAVFGHEIGHTDKNNVLTWAQGGDHEKDPSKVHTAIINETAENKKQ